MSQRRRTLLISLTALILAGVLLFQGYHRRCMVLDCPRLTWAEIQAIARTYARKAGPDYRIGHVFVEPAYGTPMTPDGPEMLRIRIEFVGSTLDWTGMYPVRQIEFQDRDRLITWRGGIGGRGDPPSLESQQRFERVRIGPREAYQLTWQLAQHDLSESTRPHPQKIVLFVDDYLQEQGGPESQWVVNYYDTGRFLSYTVDAETGQILDQPTD